MQYLSAGPQMMQDSSALLSGMDPSPDACLQTDDQWKEAMKFLETLGSKELTETKTKELEEAAGAKYSRPPGLSP